MIAFIKGEIDSVSDTGVIIDHNGMGFDIRVPGSVITNLPPQGEHVKLYTYMYVREDILQLYGFLTKDELAMFQLLITVNGIGPKAGLAILSVMSADDVRYAILSEDAKSIAKAQGVGPKAANKIILELKDKCKLEDVIRTPSIETGFEGVENNQNDAIQALVALGYNATQALQAVRKVQATEDMSVEDILKQSLTKM